MLSKPTFWNIEENLFLFIKVIEIMSLSAGLSARDWILPAAFSVRPAGRGGFPSCSMFCNLCRIRKLNFSALRIPSEFMSIFPWSPPLVSKWPSDQHSARLPVVPEFQAVTQTIFYSARASSFWEPSWLADWPSRRYWSWCRSWDWVPSPWPWRRWPSW